MRQRDSLQNLHPPRAVLNPLLRVPNLNHSPASQLRPSSVCSLLFATLFLWTFAARLIVSLCAASLSAGSCCARPPTAPSWSAIGDSITAGYGLQAGQSYPDALQRDLDARGYHYKVVNQGTSGATTKDAVAGLPLHPAAAPRSRHRRIRRQRRPARPAPRPDPPQSRPGADHARKRAHQNPARRHHPAAQLRPRLHPVIRPDLPRPGRQTPRCLRAHDLQRPGPRSRHHPARRHPSHRQRLRDHRRTLLPALKPLLRK